MLTIYIAGFTQGSIRASGCNRNGGYHCLYQKWLLQSWVGLNSFPTVFLWLSCLFKKNEHQVQAIRWALGQKKILDKKMASLNGITGVGTKQPLFSFGVITDVQYADIPDGHSFLGVPRYYRHSILALQRAVRKWNQIGKLQFTLHFGDIVDGFCPKEESRTAVLNVIKEFDQFNGPVYHMLGNHCLYNLPRSDLVSLLKIPSPNGHAYYDFSPVPDYRFVVLDGYDISVIGWPENHPHSLEAAKYLETKNPNKHKNSPEGLTGNERRFVMFNGGVGREQLAWLDCILQDATACKQKVIICCHLPLDPAAASPESLLWDYDEVMHVIHKYNCVKACLAGHAHKGGYAVDSHGIHHRVLEAVLECPPGSDAFGYIDVYHDRLLLIGMDRMESTEMIFDLEEIST